MYFYSEAQLFKITYIRMLFFLFWKYLISAYFNSLTAGAEYTRLDTALDCSEGSISHRQSNNKINGFEGEGEGGKEIFTVKWYIGF